MSNNVDFFAINADDVPRARQFYEKVFNWSFEPWGPPDFYLIDTGKEPSGAIRGALQERRELAREQKMIGFECTIVSRRTSTRRFVPSRPTAAALPRRSRTSRRWELSPTSSTLKATSPA